MLAWNLFAPFSPTLLAPYQSSDLDQMISRPSPPNHLSQHSISKAVFKGSLLELHFAGWEALQCKSFLFHSTH